MENQIEGAAVILNDPAAVQSLADLSVGGSRKLCVGGKASRFTDPPLELNATLVSRSDGRFELEDRESHLASMCGVNIDMGPCAVGALGRRHGALDEQENAPLRFGPTAQPGDRAGKTLGHRREGGRRASPGVRSSHQSQFYSRHTGAMQQRPAELSLQARAAAD